MTVEERVRILEQEIDKIKARNRRVEWDKAWETSKARTAFISVVTFLLLLGFMILINAEHPLLNAVVATVAYWLSTETYGILKQWWLKRKV